MFIMFIVLVKSVSLLNIAISTDHKEQWKMMGNVICLTSIWE